MFKETLEIVQRGTLELSEQPCYPCRLSPEEDQDDGGGGGPAFNNFMLFHFSMWLQQEAEKRTTPITNFRVILDVKVTNNPVIEHHRSAPLWIIFEKASDRKSFKKWLRRYGSWFENGIDRAFFPPLPTCGNHSLSFVKTDFGKQFDISNFTTSYPEDAVEKWIWILANCSQPVYVIPNGLAFSSAKEGVHYKLRWS